MGKLLELAIPYDPDCEGAQPLPPFRGGYILIPHSSIQTILTWSWHDVYYAPDRLVLFLRYLLAYSKKFGSGFKHSALAGIMEEMRDCRLIVEEHNAESGRWMTLQDRGDLAVPRDVLSWCTARSTPRYALGLALIACSQMRRCAGYKFAINQSWMAHRLGASSSTISRLVSDMLKDGLIEHLGKAGKAKNGEIYRWACSNYGKKKPEVAPENIIRFVLPATGEKSILRAVR